MATYPQAASVLPAGAAPAVGAPRTPPLESGDRLSREEFERRWVAMPNLKYAELIGGVVYLQAPLSHSHGQPHGIVMAWLVTYSIATPGTVAPVTPSVRMDDSNMPQPDALLYIDAAHGGQCKISDDDYLEGAPELIVEVAASSASRDMHMKKDMYRLQGVREYVVLRVYERAVDWFVLRDGQYESMAPGDDGVLRSGVFPGLWLDPAALAANLGANVLQQLKAGLASAEHAAFVERLTAPPTKT